MGAMDAYIFSLEKRPVNCYETKERNTANVASPSAQAGIVLFSPSFIKR